MFSLPILHSCRVLLCIVNTLSGQCVVSVKCMSLAMHCVIIIKYSVLMSQVSLWVWHYTENIRESLSVVKSSVGLGLGPRCKIVYEMWGANADEYLSVK